MRTESTIRSEVRGVDGLVKYKNLRHNLTTDTASGYTNRRDWQSKAMGLADAVATYVGAATASSATTLTNSGAAFPTTGQSLSGRLVAVGPNSSGTGSTVFGMIVSNTATVLTVDRWYNPGTYAAGTTPNATGTYQVLPGQFPAPYIAVTENATAAAATDTTLTAELAADGFTRALGTYSHTAAASTYSLQVVFNATGTRTINKTSLNGSAVTSTGVMPFESAMPNPPTLVSGDQLTETYTITIN
jgi:hypothetical protein